MRSVLCRKKFVLWARKISGATPARLKSANNSTHTAGLRYHLMAGCMFQLLCFPVNFDEVLKNGIIAVPLNEIAPAHEGSVLGSATVIVPRSEEHTSELQSRFG